MGDLEAEQILDVEDVDGAGAEGGDLGRGDLQVQLGDGGGDVVKETGPVAAVDLDQGIGGGCRVVDHHPGLIKEHPGAGGQVGLYGEPLGQTALGGNHPFQGIFEPAQRPRFAVSLAVDVLDPERIQRHAVAHGENLGIDDIGARERHGAGDPREQAPIVDGVDHHLGDGAEPVDTEIDDKRRVVIPGAGDQLGVAVQGIAIEGEPVRGRGPGRELIEFLVAPIFEAGAEIILGGFGPLGPAARRQLARHHVFGGVIKFAQQRRFPAVPDIGTDRADIGDGQAQEKAQAFRRLHHLDKISHRLGIVDIAAEGGVAHHEMVTHQPGDGLGLFSAEPQPRPQPQRNLGADHRMIAAAALGDVVKQQRQV